MLRIFVSYRRDDADLFAGRLCDRLQSEYGRENVFIDVDSIPLGVDFRQKITDAIRSCDCLLAVIGEKWVNIGAGGLRRLDDPRDYVRLEIATALKAGVPVIPVLVGSTEVPTEAELPDDLKPLAFRNACSVPPGRDFHLHVERLIKGINSLRRDDDGRPEQHEVAQLMETRAPAEPESDPVLSSDRPWIEIASGSEQEKQYELTLDGHAPIF